MLDRFPSLQILERNEGIILWIELQNAWHRDFDSNSARESALRRSSPQNLAAVPPSTASLAGPANLSMNSMAVPITSEYDAATVHTGQSEPIISRSGPKASNATSRYGLRCSGRHVLQSASVTSPETFENTFGNFAKRRKSLVHGSSAPLLIGGFAI